MNKLTKQLLPFCSLIFIFSLWTFLVPHEFLTYTNLTNVLTRSSVNMIMAAGMTFVIITAGIDLSVGTMMGMCGMVGALVMLLLGGASWSEVAAGENIAMSGGAMLGGILAGVGIGALCGFASGMLITRLRLAPFIVTLGAMSIFRGGSLLLNNGKPFTVSAFTVLDTGRILGVPVSVMLMVTVLVVMSFVLKYTPFGRHTYAVGSSVETAFHAGVDVKRLLVTVYAMTGALVGLAAMITTSRASSAQPTAGLSLELDVIAAVIIGGCSPSGGRGSMLGTVIGTLLIGVLRNGLTLCGISTNWQLVTIGLIIILAVAADQMATRR